MAILIRDCPHCPATSVAFSLKWDHNLTAGVFNAAAICGACRGPIVFIARDDFGGSSSMGPTKATANIEPSWTVVDMWPSRALPSAPPHTPVSVAARFREGEAAYNRQSWNAAVAMYRSALDIATKGLPGVPLGQNFYKRLIWLREEGRITEEMKSWADQVRIEGNEALHDPEDFEEEDAQPLRLFTEMFLRYIFELPGEVAAFKAETSPI